MAKHWARSYMAVISKKVWIQNWAHCLSCENFVRNRFLWPSAYGDADLVNMGYAWIFCIWMYRYKEFKKCLSFQGVCKRVGKKWHKTHMDMEHLDNKICHMTHTENVW